MLISKGFAEKIIRKKFAFHIDSPYCESSKEKGRCLTSCESALGCRLYFRYIDMLKTGEYRTVDDRVDDRIYKDFMIKLYDDVKVKISETRDNSTTDIIGCTIKKGFVYGVIADDSCISLHSTYQVKKPFIIIAEVNGTDEEVNGNMWVDDMVNPIALRYHERLECMETRIPIFGYVYECNLFSIDTTKLIDRPDGLRDINDSEFLGKEYIHNDELDHECCFTRKGK